MPVEHELHVDSSAAPWAELNLPNAHATHPSTASWAFVPFTLMRYHPASHDLHSDCPVVVLNRPASQLMHTVCAALLEYIPASHGLHPVCLSALVKNPATHAVHDTEPDAGANFPGTQLAHVVLAASP